jgi:hypothetical protein
MDRIVAAGSSDPPPPRREERKEAASSMAMGLLAGREETKMRGDSTESVCVRYMHPRRGAGLAGGEAGDVLDLVGDAADA